MKNFMSKFLVVLMVLTLFITQSPSVTYALTNEENNTVLNENGNETIPAEEDQNDIPAQVSDLVSLQDETTDTPVVLSEGTVTACGFTVKGGTQGTDYACNGTILEVKTSTPIEISNTDYANNYGGGIKILSGVEADVTLNNVKTYTAGAPALNVDGNAKLYLTLADGSINYLNASGASGHAALRVSPNAELVIDDSIRNCDIYGNMVTPKQGVIEKDVVLKNGTSLKVGDSITKMEPDYSVRGKLIARGGEYAAAIGGSNKEYPGTMTFNGGEVYAFSWGGQNVAYTTNTWPLEALRETSINSGSASAGTGIGGGDYAGGSNIIFNGGLIDARGSYHGAGVGSGWHSANSGNITIHGGYLLARGYDHGNAFGQGCGGNATGKTFFIDGGTLLPSSQPGKFDIGGTGGNVIVTGGSVRLSGAGKFQGNAYDENSNPVFMITINLSAEGYEENVIEKWGLKIDSVPYEYGAPSMLDDGKLYLWLPQSAIGKNIEVNATVRDKDGNLVELEPLYIENASGDGSSTLKRYIDFEFPKDYEQSLVKYYDGTAFGSFQISTVPSIAPANNFNKIPEGQETNGIWTDEAIPKLLSKDDALKFSYVNEKNETGNTLPVDAGDYVLTMISTQYSNSKEDGFSESYWGHRATGSAKILPVDSKTTVEVTRDINNESNKKITITANITSAEEMSVPGNPHYQIKPTCGFPLGKVQFYIDGNKLGDEIEVVLDASGKPVLAAPVENVTVSSTSRDEATNTRNHTVVTYEYTPSQNDIWLLEPKVDNKHTITVKYTASKNFNDSEGYPTIDDLTKTPIEIIPIPNDGFELKVTDQTNGGEVVTEDHKVGGKDVLEETVLTLKHEADGNYYYFTLDVKTDSEAPIDYTILNPDIAEIVEVKKPDGTTEVRVRVKGCGNLPIKVTQKATGAYEGSEREFNVEIPLYGNMDPEPIIIKSAVNLDYPDKAVKAGDTVRYTIEVKNGRIGSVWANVSVYDSINKNLEVNTKSFMLIDNHGKTKRLASSCYNPETGLLSFDIAKAILGGESYFVTFEATVSKDYNPDVDGEILNIANAQGYGPKKETDDPITNPDPDKKKDPDEYYDVDEYTKPTGEPKDTDPDNPDPTIGGTPSGEIKPTPVVPEDPTDANIILTKTAKNLDSSSGSKPQDRVEYTITISNTKRGSVWYDAAIIDTLPEGLEIDSETPIIVTDVDGNIKEITNDPDVYNDIYNDINKTLGLFVGDIYGGQKASVTFTAIVQEEGDLKNIAKASGSTPSEKEKDKELDPTVPKPVKPGNPDPKDPGKPWDPTKDKNPGETKINPESKPVYPTKKDDPNHKGGNGQEAVVNTSVKMINTSNTNCIYFKEDEE